MKKIRVVVKEPGKPPRVDSITPDLQGLRAVLDGGYLEALPIGPGFQAIGVHAYGDEEAKLKRLPPNFAIPGDVVCGNVIFATDDGDGNEASLDEDQVRHIMGSFGVPWAPQN